MEFNIEEKQHIMTLFKNGEKVVYRNVSTRQDWQLTDDPGWDWAINDYRIFQVLDEVPSRDVYDIYHVYYVKGYKYWVQDKSVDFLTRNEISSAGYLAGFTDNIFYNWWDKVPLSIQSSDTIINGMYKKPIDLEYEEARQQDKIANFAFGLRDSNKIDVITSGKFYQQDGYEVIDSKGGQSIQGSLQVTTVTNDESSVINKKYFDENTKFAAKYSLLDLRSLNTSYFYPVIWKTEMQNADIQISSENRWDSEPYNQNTIHFNVSAQGSTDKPKLFSILQYGCYDYNEKTIGSISLSNNKGNNCIWLRGGLRYHVFSNTKLVLYSTNFSSGSDIYNVGTAYANHGSGCSAIQTWSPKNSSVNLATNLNVSDLNSSISTKANRINYNGTLYSNMTVTNNGGAVSINFS